MLALVLSFRRLDLSKEHTTPDTTLRFTVRNRFTNLLRLKEVDFVAQWVEALHQLYMWVLPVGAAFAYQVGSGWLSIGALVLMGVPLMFPANVIEVRAQ